MYLFFHSTSHQRSFCFYFGKKRICYRKHCCDLRHTCAALFEKCYAHLTLLIEFENENIVTIFTLSHCFCAKHLFLLYVPQFENCHFSGFLSHYTLQMTFSSVREKTAPQRKIIKTTGLPEHCILELKRQPFPTVSLTAVFLEFVKITQRFTSS